MIGAARFNPVLESLRGIAALAVCFTHSIAIYRLDGSGAIWTVPIWKQSWGSACLTLLNAIFNPDAAVILFFILSGYVLTRSLTTGDPISADRIVIFFIKRGFRILPIMWIALAFSYVLATLDHTPPSQQTSTFYTSMFERQLHFADLVRNSFLIDFDVSPVTWTMRVELVGSFFMPALAYFVVAGSRNQKVGLLAGLTLLVVAAHTDFRYLVCFYVGALLTDWRKFPGGVNLSFYLVCCGITIWTLGRLSLWGSHPTLALLVTTLASGFFLLGILAGRPKFEVLTARPFRTLGRLSYSLYLLHPPLLGVCAVAGFSIGIYPKYSATASNLILFSVSAATAAALSACSYQWVERPSIALGRVATKSWLPALQN